MNYVYVIAYFNSSFWISHSFLKDSNVSSGTYKLSRLNTLELNFSWHCCLNKLCLNHQIQQINIFFCFHPLHPTTKARLFNNLISYLFFVDPCNVSHHFDCLFGFSLRHQPSKTKNGKSHLATMYTITKRWSGAGGGGEVVPPLSKPDANTETKN